MTANKVVIEVDSFSAHDDPDEYDKAAAAGAVGVIVKVSQGLLWEADAWEDDVEAAHDAGLLVGVLHYLEPQRSDIEVEAAKLVARVSPGVYELGVTLEVEPPLGDDLYGFSIALEAALGRLEGAGFTPGLRCDGATLATITGAPWAVRWWCGVPSEMVSAVPFGTWAEDCPLDGDERWPGGYVLTSVRGLNVGGLVVRATETLDVSEGLTAAVEPTPERTEGASDGGDPSGETVDVSAEIHGETVDAGDDDPDAEGGRDDEDPDWRAAAAKALA